MAALQSTRRRATVPVAERPASKMATRQILPLGARASTPAEITLRLTLLHHLISQLQNCPGRKKPLTCSTHLEGTAAKMAARKTCPKAQRRRALVGRAVHCAPLWVMQTRPSRLESRRPRFYKRGYQPLVCLGAGCRLSNPDAAGGTPPALSQFGF